MLDRLAPSIAFVLLCLVAPIVPGVATRTRAFLTGRRGSPVWQLYADLWKLIRRGIVYARVTTIPFRLVPIVVLASVLVSALFVPLDGRASLFAFAGDIVAFAYTLALARFVLVLGAMDTGSSFEGMGASREVTFAALVEFGLFVALAALSLATRQLSLSGMAGAPLADRWTSATPALAMVIGGVFILLLAECSRSPVDDPTTHLELTMIHEAMILEYSGRYLALIEWASSIKLFLFLTLLANIFLPWGVAATSQPGAVSIGFLALAFKMSILAATLAILETAVAKLRLFRVPALLSGSFMLALLAVISFFFLR
jgi:formate hydrogenlyase subunit 4